MEAFDKGGHIELLIPTSNHQQSLPSGRTRGVRLHVQPDNHTYTGFTTIAFSQSVFEFKRNVRVTKLNPTFPRLSHL
jgi:hypothetical protein